MRMKRTILILCSLMAIMMTTRAQEAEKDAVYAWVNGTSKCYRLTDMPKVSYENGSAVLTINGVEQLRVPAERIDQLVIVYGVYKEDDTPTSTDPAESAENSPVRQVDKYIMGGQLIIVVDGVQYDVHGRRIDVNQLTD